MEIRSKVALVTGGAVRVGKEIALGLARAGADVAILYHSSSAAAADTVQALETLGVRGVAIAADMTEVTQVQGAAAAVQDRLGGIDIVVHAASHLATTPLLTTTYDEWRHILGVLLDGPFFLTQAVVPIMQARGGGVIVNILDTSIDAAWPRFLAHAAGKMGLLSLTRNLAVELAPAIRVNAVVPGPVLPPDGYPIAKIERAAQQTLLQRWGTPRDVADAVEFLVRADYVTGTVLHVDGGQQWVR